MRGDSPPETHFWYREGQWYSRILHEHVNVHRTQKSFADRNEFPDNSERAEIWKQNPAFTALAKLNIKSRIGEVDSYLVLNLVADAFDIFLPLTNEISSIG